ncbi:unnamed protein product [Anisakis simplex]|uniref:Uncharacterized protein n=1 Tax=Anisakis simplex TaxID=6269 RepID=A0A3P6UC19_ANISI|nr:unnamed protein product [Anisakis simplex]
MVLPFAAVFVVCDGEVRRERGKEEWDMGGFPSVCGYGEVWVSILLGIELCWNTYPSTALSSAMLHVFHVIVVCSLVLSRYYLSSDYGEKERLEMKRQ